MQKFIKTLRYSSWFSKLIRHPSRLVFNVSSFLNAKIRTGIKINSGSVSYYGYPLIYPKQVGMGTLTNLFWNGERGFEPANGKLLIALFERCSIFLDVGSNYGFYSVLARKVNGSIRVRAFEPNAEMARHNKLFAEANAVSYDIDHRGLSDREGVLDFFIPEKDGAKEVTTASFNNDFFFNKNRNTKKVAIHCSSLDAVWIAEFEKMERCPKVVVKIDVEGHERNVMAGAQKFISAVRPFIVCEVEMQAQNTEAIFSQIAGHDYSIFHIQPLGLVRLAKSDFRSNFGKHRDFLFLPNQHDGTYAANFVPLDKINPLIGSLPVGNRA